MELHSDPDRLFPVEPGAREIARDLYESVADLPIISPHGHVDPNLLLDDEPFPDPTELLLRYDHYVTRLLHASGIPLTELGVPDRTGGAPTAEPRAAWRRFCENWHLFATTRSPRSSRARPSDRVLSSRSSRSTSSPRRTTRDAVLRFRAAVTETAGFYRSSGFIDDTRAFLSTPARHDMARRLDSAFLARLVAEGRLDRPMAQKIAVDLVDTMPRKVLKL